MARRKKISPLHPGEVLNEDFIVPTGISIHRLAMDLRVPANRIAEIVKGERAVSADTALRLAVTSAPRRNSGLACKPTTISKRPRTSWRRESSAMSNRASARKGASRPRSD